MANKNNVKNIILVSGAVVAASFAVMGVVAKKKKGDSVYENKPEEKNPFEGKKVRFVEDEVDAENADGVKGHLEAVGDAEYKGSFYDKYGKRALDVFLSGMGLIVLSPVFAGISLAIKIDDPGPVLFTQKRVGKNKQYFKLHKFRSMKMSTPHDVPTHMLDNPESYITKVGKFLRAHSLDELPQIWDIFIGNMSVIGPRPALWNQDVLTAERDKYNANDIKPGLTGWAQINGRDELEIVDKAKLDGEYVKNEGPAMDLKCFLGSLGVFGGDKSVVEGGTGELHKENKLRPGVPETDPEPDFGFRKTFHIDKSRQIKVLVVGAGSYIGETFASYAKEHYPNITVDTVGTLNGEWRDVDFSSYDCIYDVAGIAHADVGNVSDEVKEKYYAVNTDLTLEICKKAKEAAGERSNKEEAKPLQFIFMSSAIIYGDSAPYGTEKMIDEDTIPQPANFYGDSKWQADKGVRVLSSDNFNVAVLRPPMIYGKGSKGNYPTLAKFAKKLPIFPDVDNERSMLYVGNLCEFLCLLMLSGEGGVYFPQNNTFTKTSEMVKEISKVAGKNVLETKALNLAVKIGQKVPGKIGGLVDKAFGNLTYDQKLSHYEGIEYQKSSLGESIELTEGTSSPKRMLMLASVASMIDQFNMPNIKLLLSMGYEVDVACNFKEGNTCSDEEIEVLKKNLDELGVKYFQIDFTRHVSKIIQDEKAYKQVLKLCKDRNYAFIHCHSPIGGVIGRMVGHKLGIKVIYTAHGFHFYDGAPKKNWIIYYPIEKELSRWTDILITINKEDYIRAKNEFHAKEVVYIPGVGIDTHKYGFKILTDEQIQEDRKNIGIKDDQVWILSVGEMNENKNHETVIKAIGELSDDDKKKVFYTIAGQGDKQEELQKLIDTLNLQDNVKLLGFRDDVPKLYDAADIFIHPSFREGLSVALMEAMSSGLPVIASRIRGNVDLVDDDGGELFDPKSVEECKKAIKSLLDKTTEERASAGLYNRNKIKHFDSETVEKAIKEEYEKLDSSNIGGDCPKTRT